MLNGVKNIFSNFSRSLTIKEKALFAKRLSFLVKAGVPIVESFRILKDQSKSRAKGRIFEKVAQDISNGKTLAGSLEKFKGTFDKFSTNLIKVGEESGTLEENLNHLSEELKKRQLLQRKVFGALVYPFFIIVATLVIAGVLTIVIFPKVMPIFQSLNVQLPITTRILIFVSDFLGKYWYWLVGLVIALIVLFIYSLKFRTFRFVIDSILLKLPILGELITNYNLANICRTLGTLLRSNVKIVRAFIVTAEATSNLAYRKELELISKSITRGEKIVQQMKGHPNLFPHVLLHMIAIGETTGNLDDTLRYLSEMYEGEVDDMTKNLSTIIEPALMIFMGVIVGFIAVSIITPIYEVTKTLSR